MLVFHLITGLECGGAEHLLQQFILASDPRRFRHVVISMQEGGAIAVELKNAGVEVRSLAMTRGFPSPVGIARLVRLLQEFKPDIVHCWLYHGCLAGLIGKQLVGVPRLIWGLHSANPGLRAYSLLTRGVVRLCAMFSSRVDAIIAVSQRCWTVHQDLGYETGRMRIIANGVDVKRFSPDASARRAVLEELGLPQQSILVGLFARYSPMKDHATFLRAGELVRQRCADVRFILAGSGITPDNQPLLQLVRDSKLEDAVCLLGSRHDMPRLAAALDIACLSSWSESFGIVALEAMACAVPCVVTNVGDLASVVQNTGRVVPPSDPSAMAKAMMALIAMPPNARAAMGQRARERVLEQYALPKMVNAYESLYEESRCEAGTKTKQRAPYRATPMSGRGPSAGFHPRA